MTEGTYQTKGDGTFGDGRGVVKLSQNRNFKTTHWSPFSQLESLGVKGVGKLPLLSWPHDNALVSLITYPSRTVHHPQPVMGENGVRRGTLP